MSPITAYKAHYLSNSHCEPKIFAIGTRLGAGCQCLAEAARTYKASSNQRDPKRRNVEKPLSVFAGK
jgi:hypothetical protein